MCAICVCVGREALLHVFITVLQVGPPVLPSKKTLAPFYRLLPWQLALAEQDEPEGATRAIFLSLCIYLFLLFCYNPFPANPCSCSAFSIRFSFFFFVLFAGRYTSRSQHTCKCENSYSVLITDRLAVCSEGESSKEIPLQTPAALKHVDLMLKYIKMLWDYCVSDTVNKAFCPLQQWKEFNSGGNNFTARKALCELTKNLKEDP